MLLSALSTTTAAKNVRSVGICLALFLAACGAEPAFDSVDPALFIASDEDTTIYLFGSVHRVPCLSPPRDPPVCAPGFSGAVEEAIREADQVWLEVVLSAGAQVGPNLLREHGFFQNGGLADFVPMDEINLIAQTLAEDLGAYPSTNVAVVELALMMPWLVTLVLGQSALDEVSSIEFGVDFQVDRFARGLGIPVLGLESSERSFTVATLEPLELQISDLRSFALLLLSGVDIVGYLRWLFAEIWEAWSTGAFEELGQLAYGGGGYFPPGRGEELADLFEMDQQDVALLRESIGNLFDVTVRRQVIWNR